MDSVKLVAPTGRIMNSCIASLLPACDPPLMMLNDGTGKHGVGFPARSAMYCHKGFFLAAAPPRHRASDTPKIALAPMTLLVKKESRPDNYSLQTETVETRVCPARITRGQYVDVVCQFPKYYPFHFFIVCSRFLCRVGIALVNFGTVDTFYFKFDLERKFNLDSLQFLQENNVDNMLKLCGVIVFYPEAHALS
ncbi:hypothetical protein PsorP6_003578 [Peronosclerospora sorghi]|uniref:Uncharacterized protein n=1 Tax=Peronosclerospora sorghi TaxID=230839 RepID=A0ACC0VQD2_9STRA|nr:hypothetical protein PsorP6_003578 [Peronosclerospora sorghi]